jgi:dihydroxyacetone kinase-like predicted kinase
VEHDRDHGLEANVQRLRAALDGIRTGAVAPAARDDKQGRFSEGDAVGFVDETIVAWGAPEATLRAVLEALAERSELLTCMSGEGAPLDHDAIAPLVPATVEIEFHAGGQPHYWWLLAGE